MWVEKTKTGYRLCDRVKVNGKIKRVTVPLEKDTAQARRRATEALNEKIRGFSHADARISLNEAMEDYLKTKDCRESTRKQVRGQFRIIADLIGNVKMADLSPLMIQKALIESGKPKRTLNAYINRLITFFRWAYANELIESDLAGRIRYFKDDTPPKDEADLYLEPEELTAVLDQLDGMYFYLIKFLALTGCRIGEVSPLLVSDLSENYININKAFSAITGEISEPKNKYSCRKIYIQPELRELLDDYLKFRRVHMLAYGIRTDLLFFSQNGTMMREQPILQYLNRNVKSEKKLHPHIFRHTHTAILAEQGVSLDAISRRLGHSGTITTRKIYYHVTQKQKKKDEEALAAVRFF